MTPTPVVLLTGFLGSGKTTLLNRLLGSPDFADTAVVINEAGSVGLDHALIEKGEEDVVMLEGGCICCRLRGSLNRTLNDLVRRRAKDGMGFSRVVVETSGLADPEPILHALVADPLFVRHYAMSGVVTVVDAVHALDTLADHVEGRMQVALADRLLITKTDIATHRRAPLESALTALNPMADRLVAAEMPDAALVWLDPGAVPSRRPNRTPRCHAVPSDAVEIATASRVFPGALSRCAIDDWLDHTSDLFGPALLRLKGILQVEGVAEPVVLHGVQGLVYSPGTAPREAGRDNRMVLIARDLPAVLLEDALDRLAARVVH
ncbi:CobW family GTP-binding protein [Acuticoccus mangrovi]|uniref:GTP-binding protein n=1 Tax=Acuticoccus mangrovi TaxID=2796142 RepID=A0A934IGG7_9HYPH|nr:GTP-binding protein [Acuticoccus mangrovi]MBJ3774541.1 GTP-binding protein [Acuticoccus mangrovi]